MGANEEQIQLLVSAGIDHVSYTLILFSVAFVLYFCTFPQYAILRTVILYLIRLYLSSGRNAGPWILKSEQSTPMGRARMTSMEQRRIRDVEEFELGGLLDEEENGSPTRESSSLEHTPLAKRSSIDRE